MITQVYDLSQDRSEKPEVIAVPRGTKSVVVLRCDVPATLFLGGASSDPIAAIPGAMIADPPGNMYLQNWADHYDGAVLIGQGGGGKLILGFHECLVPGSTGEIPYAIPFADEQGANANAAVSILPPTKDWSVIVTGFSYGYDIAPTSTPSLVATFAEYPNPSGISIAVLRETNMTTAGLRSHHFTKPLIGPQGYSFNLTLTAGGVGVLGSVFAWGALIR